MSAYIEMLTPMVDKRCLLLALADVGFGSDKVQAHETALRLTGYEGGARAQTAEIVIGRQHLSGASNDLGFTRSATGYKLVVSDFDRRAFGAPWLTQLVGRYNHHVRVMEERAAEEERRRMEEQRRELVEAQRQAIFERAKKLGYQVTEKREADKVRLVLVKRVY
ncbi:MAG: DUF1257 domain-containing protein [Polyangiaceae bacterium]|nr:DUF1257 domain-containing protein [Polyangiaceae bacterium]